MPQTRSHMAVLDALTDKQREVLSFVADGLTSKEIARKLNISESAVNQRIETIRQRLGGMQRAQIARLFRLQSAIVMTIPTSNSLAGKSIVVQPGEVVGQASRVEGVSGRAAPQAQQGGDVLQPSTTFRQFEELYSSPGGAWWRVITVVGLAAVMAIVALVTLSSARVLQELLAG